MGKEIIPKTIYYCWFGGNSKPLMLKKCLKSWEKYCPDFNIIEINESNFDYNQYHFSKNAYLHKKWAFVSDVARLHFLYNYGGIYLDTDMELIKNIDPFLQEIFFCGFESKYLSCGIIGAKKKNKIIKDCIQKYKDSEDSSFIPIPKILTEVCMNLGLSINGKLQRNNFGSFYPKEYFYPYHFTETYNSKCITPHTFSIHWWDNSWEPNSIKLIRKLRIYFVIRYCLKIKYFLNRM